MEFSTQRSIYMQIADYFYENILKGKWTPDMKVPSVRQLAVELEVNPNTVMRTYTILQDKEILYNQRGIGFFVTSKAPELVQALVRERFLEEQLPKVFETIEILGMDWQEMKEYFIYWKSAK
jgi:GntR family transcriptional regulator